MSVKFATLGPLTIKLFWNKGNDLIIFVHNITNKILPRDSVDVFMWPKLGISRIFMRGTITTTIL